MNEHAADLGTFITTDPRGQHLPSYLCELAECLEHERISQIKEVELLQKNIGHIKEIVAMQQSYAQVSGLSETANTTELVEDALRMNPSSLTRHEILVVREYDPHGSVITVEKHKVLQILVNLVRNAKYSCDESGRTDKRLIVRVANGDGRIKISVTDNGVGISQDNLTRIFNHGFTTKKDGHGFGLHSGALAAREMGGSLNVHSDGSGQGATFTLELPVSSADKRATLSPNELPLDA
jgi:signal transduction histidine kinase